MGGRLAAAGVTFLGAFLTFSIQPLVAKAILPTWGGAPAVWITCLVFFQATLLAGYAAADRLGRWCPGRIQPWAWLVLAAAGLVALPPWPTTAFDDPISPLPAWTLIRSLAESLALPMIAVGTTAPLLPLWRSNRLGLAPITLYAVSNAGSLLALVSYPFLIEPNVGLEDQSRLWAIGYVAWMLGMLGCGLVWAGHPPIERPRDEFPPVSAFRWWGWVARALIPSSLLAGVTLHLTTDLSSAPLVWVVPLALYLLTFIATFASPPWITADIAARLLAWTLLPLASVMIAGFVHWIWIPLHLAAFVLAATACHGRLAEVRPAPRDLTSFYLAIATGGVLGSAFNALVAPLLFDRVVEYPLMLIAACLASQPGRITIRRSDLLLPSIVLVLGLILARKGFGALGEGAEILALMTVCGALSWIVWTQRRNPVRFALGLGAAWLAGGASPGVDGRTLVRDRTFHGILRVTEVEPGPRHRFFHGSTLHGEQDFRPGRQVEPLSYYRRTGPVDQVFTALTRERPEARVGVVGLGVGTLSAYSRPGQDWTYFEIDPEVARIARDPRLFRFLEDAPAPSKIVLGDARVRLRAEPDSSFDLLVLDAFSSDAVPVHLLTREALAEARRTLRPGGRILMNLANRYLDLESLADALADDAGWHLIVCRDDKITPDDRKAGLQPAAWGLMASGPDDLRPWLDHPAWSPPRRRPSVKVWTDRRVDLLSALRFSLSAR